MTKCNICKESIIMYNNSLGESLVKHMQAQPCAQTSHLNNVSEDLREAEKEYNRIEKLADKCSDNASKWSPGRSGNGETSNYLNELETIKKDIYNEKNNKTSERGNINLIPIYQKVEIINVKHAIKYARH